MPACRSLRTTPPACCRGCLHRPGANRARLWLRRYRGHRPGRRIALPRAPAAAWPPRRPCSHLRTSLGARLGHRWRVWQCGRRTSPSAPAGPILPSGRRSGWDIRMHARYAGPAARWRCYQTPAHWQTGQASRTAAPCLLHVRVVLHDRRRWPAIAPVHRRRLAGMQIQPPSDA
ncbi:hypothetical protein D3C72_1537980 [compost metagenome]